MLPPTQRRRAIRPSPNPAFFILLYLFVLPPTLASGISCSPSSPIAIIIFAHSRPASLKRCLNALTALLPSPPPSIYVSIDSSRHSARVARAATAANLDPSCIWYHSPSPSPTTPRDRISVHYHWALTRLFETHDTAIILEDDLVPLPGFYGLLSTFKDYLWDGDRRKDSPLCVSSWADNTFRACDAAGARLTSFFPGLGWSVRRGAWEVFLKGSWPREGAGVGWDWAVRIRMAEEGLVCVVPDIARVRHLGQGVNVGGREARERFGGEKVDGGEVNWGVAAKALLDDGVTAAVLRLKDEIGRAVAVEGLDDVALGGGDMNCGEEKKSARENVFLLKYDRGLYRDTYAKALDLWPTPRGHLYHVLRLRLSGNRVLLLADRVHATLSGMLSAPESAVPRAEAADMGVSCAEHCDTRGCDAKELEWGNSCRLLQEFFGCSRCGYETGADLPAYVVPSAGKELKTEGSCLVTDDGLGDGGVLDCHGKFAFTQRLCVCGYASESRPTIVNAADLEEFERGEL